MIIDLHRISLGSGKSDIMMSIGQGKPSTAVDAVMYFSPGWKTCLVYHVIKYFGTTLPESERAPPWSSGSVLDHRSLPPAFESRRGHI